MDEERFSVLGGEADAISARLEATYTSGLLLTDALRIAVASLAGDERRIQPADLEVAVLERTAQRRAFRRIEREELPDLLDQIS